MVLESPPGLKEVDYNSGDTDELLRRLANNGVAKQRSSPRKGSRSPKLPKASKSNNSANKRQNKKRRDKKNRKAKRNDSVASAASGRRSTRRSDESDPATGGSSQLLGLGKPTIRPNQLTPFVSVGSLPKETHGNLVFDPSTNCFRIRSFFQH